MAVEVIQGTRYLYEEATAALYADLEESIEKTIQLATPNIDPVIAFHRRAKNKHVESSGIREVKYPRDKYMPASVTLYAAITTAAQTTIVFNGNFLIKGQKLLIHSANGAAEMMMVGESSVLTYTSGTDSVSITNMVRGIGTTAITAPAGAHLRMLGDVSGDRSEARDAMSTKPDLITNYVEWKRKSIDISGFSRVWGRKYPADPKGYEAKKKLIEALTETEQTVLFGYPAKIATANVSPNSGDPLTYHMQGFVPFMLQYAPTDNVVNVGGTINKRIFQRDIVEPLQAESEDSDLVIMLGDEWINALGDFSKTGLRTEIDNDVYGVKVQYLQDSIIPNKVKIIRHRMLNPVKDWAGNVEGIMGSMLCAFDLKSNKYVKGEVEIQQGGNHVKLTDVAVVPVWLANNIGTHKEEIHTLLSMKWKNPGRQLFAFGLFDHEV